jgi:hypothetical protein
MNEPSEYRGVPETELLDRIEGGEMLGEIARSLGVNTASLLRWFAADAQRLARAREARASSAIAYDERAERVLLDAKTPLDLARARELAHHYRWRSSKIAPKAYGDKVEVESLGGAHTYNIITGVPTRDDLDARIAAMSETERHARIVAIMNEAQKRKDEAEGCERATAIDIGPARVVTGVPE